MKFELFPTPEQVFFDNVEKHSEVLIPLLTIDLKDINAAFNGMAHFILPLEPFDTLGLETGKYHTYYSRCNWIAYKLKEGKYSLETSFNYFQYNYIKSHPDFKNHFDGTEGYLELLPKNLGDEFKKIKNNFLKIKKQFSVCSEPPKDLLKYFETYSEPFQYIDNTFPNERSSLDNVAYPITKDGRAFKYIGAIDVTDLSYYDKDRKLISFNADFSIIMYYDPVDNIVLNTFFS